MKLKHKNNIETSVKPKCTFWKGQQNSWHSSKVNQEWRKNREIAPIKNESHNYVPHWY
jgi:hypothetical protein